MIQAESFVETARAYGFSRYTGVLCSFLTPFINYVINDETLNYISSANEGDALATASGAAIGGERCVVMLQNSGLGNAVSPLTSLNYVFRIPLLLIVTHRGAPGIKDEPQHVLMGEITGDLLDTMRVPWEYFPDEEDKIDPVLKRAIAYMEGEKRPYGLIMRKGTVATHALKKDSISKNEQVKQEQNDFFKSGEQPPSRNEVLREIISLTPEDKTVVIATTGFTGRELFSIKDRNNQLYMVGSMGCASSLGLGLALARPDLQVIIIDGDGAALMRMGNFSTIGAYAPKNLLHILLDNEVHDSTGAQSTVSSMVEFANIAIACGYTLAYKGNKIELIAKVFAENNASGPRFAHLKTTPGTISDLPRPDISPEQALQRLMLHIGTTF